MARPRLRKVRLIGGWGLAIALSLLLLFPGGGQLQTQEAIWPLPKIHPLPATLARWKFSGNTGNYFERIEAVPCGYLVWSEFPVKVYLEGSRNSGNSSLSSAEAQRIQAWHRAILAVVEEWNVYIPLAVVERRELADIVWTRSRPPLQATLNRETGQFDLPTARSGEASYELYIRAGNPAILSHRFTINLSPHQTNQQLLATARHELGHALGIWGHSSLPTDALYPHQSSKPRPISPRDLNTLKKIYQQPTQLGWEVLTPQSLK